MKKGVGVPAQPKKQEVIEALDAERQKETAVVWAAAQMVVAKVAIDIQAFLDGPFKIGLEAACEEIVERMKDGPDSLTSTQDAGVIRARAALAEREKEVESLRELAEERAAELIRMRDESERPKCFYCSFGEVQRETSETLQRHIEQECQRHPIHALRAERERLRGALRKIQALWHKCNRTGYDLLEGQQILDAALAPEAERGQHGTPP